MDLIGTLAETLGVDGKVAEALAGQLLGTAREQAGAAETAKLDEAVPEISRWEQTAHEVLEEDSGATEGSGGLFGSLAQMAGTGIGKELVGAVLGDEAEDTAAIVALMSKLGLKTEHAAMAAPVVIDFLEDRIGKEWLDRLVSAAPMLSGFLARK